jgi:XTP/dITP diphosphohydrolase
MTTLLIATRNAHKVGEIRAILGPAFTFLTLNDFPAAPAVVEDAETFAGNACKKAAELAAWVTGRRPPPDFVLADDSGLEVDALAGAPGVHSARFAAQDGAAAATGNSPDADNNAKLLRLLAEVPSVKRTARFRCVIALVPVTGCSAVAQIFEGACEGRIQSVASGRGGFGYDPLFIPDGFTQSFAELGEDVKNRLSHRARALAGLRAFLGRSAVVPGR